MPLSADSPHTTEIVLFGVRVKVKEGGGASGYASADDAAPKTFASIKPKRGTPSPWTEEEHKHFLIGLENLRKGDWKGISHNYVKTRTPIQVASHAQKYFLYQSNLNRRRHRRRPSLFDMPTESVAATPMEDARNEQQIPAKLVARTASVPQPVTSNANVFSTIVPFHITNAPVLLSMQGGNPLENCQNFLVNNSSPMFVHRLEPASSSRAMNMRAYHNYKHS